MYVHTRIYALKISVDISVNSLPRIHSAYHLVDLNAKIPSNIKCCTLWEFGQFQITKYIFHSIVIVLLLDVENCICVVWH